jgi:hypothetical protein
MTKALTDIDRMHRKLTGYKNKYELRFERDMAAGKAIIARSEGRAVPDDTATPFTPRRPITRERLPLKRERLPIKRERLNPAPVLPKAPINLSMWERAAMQPRKPVDQPEYLVNVSRSPVGLLADYAGHALTSHETMKHRLLSKTIQQSMRGTLR